MSEALPEWLSATLAADATGGRGALAPWIRAQQAGQRLVGPALVVALSRDDNAGVAEAAAAVDVPGTVLVLAGAAESRTACLGDLLARELRAAGVGGVVTDGLIRDGAEVAGVGLAVWCRGRTPAASAKRGPFRVGGAVPVGGVVVADGDVVVADDDGVVVWPAGERAGLLAAAADKQRRDAARLARLTGQPPAS